MSSIRHFLLVFDHGTGRLIEEQDFGTDSARAVRKYGEKEDEYKGRQDIEIVLVGSDSIETVRMTHANYFDDTIAMSKYLSGLVPGRS